VDWYLDGVHVGSQTLQWETGASTWGYFHHYNGWGGIGGTVPATMTPDWDHVLPEREELVDGWTT
jgi:hypothetical protein